LYPLFTHLYLELVCAGHKFAAAKFIKKHQSTFLSNFEFANFIRQLANVATPEDVARDEVVKTYLVRDNPFSKNISKSFLNGVIFLWLITWTNFS
jgi:WD40 associated region in TFIID subunit, NTD2 domain